MAVELEEDTAGIFDKGKTNLEELEEVFPTLDMYNLFSSYESE